MLAYVTVFDRFASAVLSVNAAVQPLPASTVPPFGLKISVYVFAVQLALNVLLPVLPWLTTTVVCAVAPLDPVQPANV